jgi:hypothetical protein
MGDAHRTTFAWFVPQGYRSRALLDEPAVAPRRDSHPQSVAPFFATAGARGLDLNLAFPKIFLFFGEAFFGLLSARGCSASHWPTPS